MNRVLLSTQFCFYALVPSVLPCAAASETSRAAEIGIELKRADVWEPVDPQTVFRAGDMVRFRFRVSSPGHVYVLNTTQAGDSTWLFPVPGKSQSSRVEPGTSYMIPGDKAWFVIAGNPGYDVTYWIVSPTTIDLRSPVTTPPPQKSTLVPRCQEGALRARGLCLDADAGARPLENTRRLPIEWKGPAPALRSRELKFESAESVTTVRGPESPRGVMVYEFRIAHQ